MKQTHSIHPAMLKMCAAISLAFVAATAGAAEQKFIVETDRIIVKYKDSAPAAKGLARALHDRTARGRLAAHEQGNPDDALAADDGDFGRGTVFHYIKQGNNRVCREVHVLQLVAGLVQHMAQRHGDCFDFIADARQVGRRQRGKQLILQKRGGIDHDPIPIQGSMIFRFPCVC